MEILHNKGNLYEQDELESHLDSIRVVHGGDEREAIIRILKHLKFVHGLEHVELAFASSLEATANLHSIYHQP